MTITKAKFKKLIELASQPIKEEKKKDEKRNGLPIEPEKQPDPKAKRSKQ